MSDQRVSTSGQQSSPPGRRGGAWLLLGYRLRPLVVLAMFGFVLFGAFRAGLLLARCGYIEDLGVGDVWDCFLVGLRFDAVAIGYALLPLALVLALAPRKSFHSSTFRHGVTAYATTIVVIGVMIEIIGAAFFLHFLDRLNWMTIVHLGHFGEAAVFIWRTYPVLILLAIVIAFGLAARWALGKVFWSRPVPSPLGRKGRLVMAAILAVLGVLACRGSLGHQSLREGSAYFSTNKILSQLALNNFFSLFHAARVTLTDEGDESEFYSFPPLGRAAEVATGMLVQQGETPLGGGANPLWRRSDPGRPRLDYNVVVIVMEGMSAKPVGVLGNSPSFTPELDRLCQEGLYFDRMYAVGPRTSRGMVGVLCGHPDVSGASVLKRDLAQGKFLTLPAIFQSRGYATMMIYGGDPNFDNMRGFFSRGGVQRFISQADMGVPEAQTGNWGVPDEITFDKAHQAFLEMGDRKFFSVILTVTNHQPFEVPPGKVPMLSGQSEEIKSLNAYTYSDWALGQFFRKARTAEYFKNTLFVLVADHGRDFDNRRIVDVPGYRIPCVFYAPGIFPPTKIKTVASQVDIPATLLAFLGGSYEHCFLGRNILALKEDDGFAVIHDEDHFAFVRGDLALVVPPKHAGIVFRLTGDSLERPSRDEVPEQDVQVLNLQMLSYYALAKHLYLTGCYRPPVTSANAHTNLDLPPAGPPSENLLRKN
ncbi:MAG: LTA synthase family protein [Phycisphaerae bacterium]|jgi:phosphoglycerol transferase MdoB-like AlkP superfamily enzyme